MSASTSVGITRTPETRGTSAVDISDLTYRYGERPALDGVSLCIGPGVIFGLLGPNGSGKSTILSLLMGLRRPTAGSLRLLGEPPSPSARARMGCVFQEPALDPLMSVRETMELQGRLFGMPAQRRHDETRRLLSVVGLLERERDLTSTLSWGMRRRLELARALMPSPRLVLLDEPTTGLDPDARQDFWRYLLDSAGADRTVVLATNDVFEAERYCDRVALLDRGRVVTEGTPSELKRDLRHDAVRIEWKPGRAPEAGELRSWEGVGAVTDAGETTLVTVDAAPAILQRLFALRGDAVAHVDIEESTLEDVYFQLVGRRIRETTRDEERA